MAGALHGVPVAGVNEQKRVAYLIYARPDRGGDRWSLVLLPGEERSITSGQADNRLPRVVRIGGVDRRRHAVVVGDTATPATAGVDHPRPRHEGGRVIAPVQQIGRAGVTPMDVSVQWRIRVVLEEHVIRAVDQADAVGIVDPSPRGSDVEGRKDRVFHGYSD